MKKFILLSVCSTAMVFTSTAQIKYGGKGGGNLSNVRGATSKANTSKLGTYGGIFANIAVPFNLSIQPEILYSAQGSKLKVNGVTTKTFHADYISVPVLVKYMYAKNLFAETGLQFSILLRASEVVDGKKTPVKNDFKSTDLSWALGLGYVFKKHLGFNARFNLGLSRLDNKSNGTKTSNGVVQAGVFYQF